MSKAGKFAIAALVVLASPLAGGAENGTPPFATVGESTIAREEYEAAVTAGVRQRFYHGRAPEHELVAVRREVGERLIERTLLLAEAARRGLRPDAALVDAEVQRYDQRYAESERWRAGRAEMLPQLAAELGRMNVLEQLERAVRSVEAPSADEVRAFYVANPAVFTAPEKLRLSLILLRVDPAAAAGDWEKAQEAARDLHERLRRGADFAALARQHSADASAAAGGDLGYLHRGMLPDAVQASVIDALRPGELSAPLRVLEGMAIVRLDERVPARLQRFEEGRARAAELAQRSRSDAAWQALIAELRARTRIRVDETAYQPASAR